MMSAIQFNRLPSRCLREILKNFDIYEVVSLATCSEKTRRLIKATGVFPSFEELMNRTDKYSSALELIQHLRLDLPASIFHEKVSVSLSLTDELKFCIHIKQTVGFKQHKLAFPIYVESDRSEGNAMETLLVEGTPEISRSTVTNWRTEMEGFKRLLGFFKKVLNLDIDRFSVNNRADHKLLEEMVKCMKNVKSLCISYHPFITPDLFKMMLSHLNVTRALDLDIPTLEDFTFNGEIKAKWVNINKAQWVTLYNLLSFKEAEHVRLFNSSLGNKDLKLYLWNWVNGKVKGLKSVSIGIENNVKVYSIVDGLQDFERKVKKSDKSIYSVDREDDSYIRITRRSDGHVACIPYPDENRRTIFEMFILE